MSRLRQERTGKRLEISSQQVKFSLWPARKIKKAITPQSEILTRNPWEAMEVAITSEFGKKSKLRSVCLSFLDQAFDFHKASETSPRDGSRPLLIYYSFLNLAKAFIVFRGVASDLGDANHGISEDRKPYRRAVIKVSADLGKKRYVYDLFSQALGNNAIASPSSYKLRELLPQIVVGHRLWAEAEHKNERFIRAERIDFAANRDKKEVWTRIDFKKSDLRALNISHQQFCSVAGLSPDFREVTPSSDGDQQEYLRGISRFEQINPILYTRRPGDELNEASAILQRRVWCVVRSVPPYRRYYFWGSQKGRSKLLPPLLSVYLVIFYLGSVTRYRPYYFEQLQSSPYGNLFDEIVQTQPQQFLFHLASEFRKRDISWPAVI